MDGCCSPFMSKLNAFYILRCFSAYQRRKEWLVIVDFQPDTVSHLPSDFSPAELLLAGCFLYFKSFCKILGLCY